MATNLIRKIGVFVRRIFIVALTFRNGLEYRNGDGQVRRALNVAISSTNLVRFGSVTPEITLLICVPWHGYWTKIGLPIFIRDADIPNALYDRNADGRVKIGDYLRVLNINSVAYMTSNSGVNTTELCTPSVVWHSV